MTAVTEPRYCQVVTTTDSAEAAGELARGVVEARLAACAQVAGPIVSTYRWQGRIESASEWQVTFKTAFDRYPALAAHIRARHGYHVPEILCLPVLGGDSSYLDWLDTETRPD